MKRLFNFGLIIILLLSQVNAKTEGYFKDVFVDGGINLSQFSIAGINHLGLSVENMFTNSQEVQDQVIIGYSQDLNGRILYPDGSPRFRLYYSHGGKATLHGRSMGHNGRERVRTFYNNGGSFSGSCAGAFIASKSWTPDSLITEYYGIWPGIMIPTGIIKSYTGQFIPENSPLLKYYDYEPNHIIDSLYHNGGGYASTAIEYPEGTEVLARYVTNITAVNDQISTWSYKASKKSGRVVVTGSHPEGYETGPQCKMIEGMYQYALEGNGIPVTKGDLLNGKPFVVDKPTFYQDPGRIMIGDKQYHHFIINIEEIGTNFSLTLDGLEGYNFNLFLDPDTFAFNSNAKYVSAGEGSGKEIMLDTIGSGTWYASVELADSIKVSGTVYWGKMEILNGIPYTITAEWYDTSGANLATDNKGNLVPNGYDLSQNYPNPFNPVTNISFTLPREEWVEIKIFNIMGQEVTTLVNGLKSAGTWTYQWNADDSFGRKVPGGVYFYRIRMDSYSNTRKMVFLE